MATAKKTTVEEFLNYLTTIQGRAEYYKGEIFDMAGGTKAHSAIQTNVLANLHAALKNSPCMVYTSDVMLKIPVSEAIFFPDGQVVCDDENQDQAESSTENPVLIVEVLSESRAAFDRGGKFQAYMKIQSLREYVLIEQSQVQIDVLSRKNLEADWIFRSYTSLEDQIHFDSLDINIAVKDIYAKIQFENQ